MDFTLDAHTAAFFAPEWHDGKIEARFHLAGLGARVFVGRLLPLRGYWFPVIQEETSSRGHGEPSPCFIGQDPFGFLPTSSFSPTQIAAYWQKYSHGDGVTLTAGREQPIRTLRIQRWSRYHFDPASGLGGEFKFCQVPGHCGPISCLRACAYLIGARKGLAERLIASPLLVGATWSGSDCAPVHNWLQVVVDMGEDFHRKAAEILADPAERLGQAFRFFRQDDDARWCELLDCSGEKMRQWKHLIAWALSCEMRENPWLRNAQKLSWHPGAAEPLLADGSVFEVSEALEARIKDSYSQLGLESRYRHCDRECACAMEEFLQKLACDWAMKAGIANTVSAAHEVANAISGFNEKSA